MKTFRTLVLSTGLLVASLVATPAASAAVTLDCSSGPVTLRGTGETYELSGACSTVTVKGSGLKVRLTSAKKITVRASNSSVTGKRLGAVTVIGSTTKVTGTRADSLTIRGAGNVARLTRVPQVAVRGASNKVTVAKGRTKVKVVGAGNVVRVPKKP